jgi:DNA-directed RNA polymerase subunit RPC12/RpoP
MQGGKPRRQQEPEPVIQPSQCDLVPFWRSASCGGETCALCGAPAALKVGEEIMHDDPHPDRHNFTAYVCLRCGNRLFFPYLFRASPETQISAKTCECGPKDVCGAQNCPRGLPRTAARRSPTTRGTNG